MLKKVAIPVVLTAFAVAAAPFAFAGEAAQKEQPAQAGASVAEAPVAPGAKAQCKPQKGDKPFKESRRDFANELVKDGPFPPPGGDGMMPPPPPPGEGGPNYEFMRRVVEMNLSEDERNGLRRMAFEKPDEFRDEMKSRFQAIHQKRVEDFHKTLALQKAYREAGSPEEKQKALDELKAFVKAQFDQKMEINRKRLEETERNLKDAEGRLTDFRRKYEERKAKADEIVAERVKDLTRDPSLEW